MRAGMRRHFVTIQRKSSSQNTYGEDAFSWVDDSETWAAILPIRGDEFFSSQQVQSSVTHKISMKYQTLSDGTRINPNCRIVLNSRIFNISSVINPEERDIDLEIMAVEEV